LYLAPSSSEFLYEEKVKRVLNFILRVNKYLSKSGEFSPAVHKVFIKNTCSKIFEIDKNEKSQIVSQLDRRYLI